MSEPTMQARRWREGLLRLIVAGCNLPEGRVREVWAVALYAQRTGLRRETVRSYIDDYVDAGILERLQEIGGAYLRMADEIVRVQGTG